MEVEKIDGGPLKSSEISRFLEASKTSYKTIENVINEKKETNFQHRTLLDIAAASEQKNKVNDAEAKKLMEEQALKAKEAEQKKFEEDERLRKNREEEEAEAARVLEQQKINQERVAQEKREKELYDKGYSDGKADNQNEVKEKLESGLLALENAKKSMLDLNASHFIKLRQEILSSIIRLTSQRIGKQIEEFPDSFLEKIEALIQSIGEVVGKPNIFVNPDDLRAIQNSLALSESTPGFNFLPEEKLLNGDIVIEMGSIAALDKIEDRIDIQSKQVSEEAVQFSETTSSPTTNSSSDTEKSVGTRDLDSKSKPVEDHLEPSKVEQDQSFITEKAARDMILDKDTSASADQKIMDENKPPENSEIPTPGDQSEPVEKNTEKQQEVSQTDKELE